MVTGESLQGRTAREELRSVHWTWNLRVPELWLRMDSLEVGNIFRVRETADWNRKVENRSAKFFFATEGREERVPSTEAHEAPKWLCFSGGTSFSRFTGFTLEMH